MRITRLFIGILLSAVVFSVIPLSLVAPQKAKAATFTMRTGYYMGTGAAGNIITGLGFQPNLVIIDSDTGQAAIYKTSAMPAANLGYFAASADTTTTMLTITADGFTVNNLAAINAANTRYMYTAFGGSDCTATGTFCVGQYTGNASNPRALTSVGFQPDLVMVKSATSANALNYRTTSMAVNQGTYITNTAGTTTGTLFASLDATGFTVGTTNNANAVVYNFIAFKSTAGAFAVGTYTGNGVDNRSITGVGFKPEVVITKNNTNATTNNRYAMVNHPHNPGELSSYIATTTANLTNCVQSLDADGFQLGTSILCNANTDIFYYMAWAGESASEPAGTGTFTMATGSYTGNGTSYSVTGLAFSPDLIIVKGSAATMAYFRTSDMKSTTSYSMTNTTVADGITAITADGFTVGVNASLNTNAAVYHYQAFGNAYKTQKRSGADDFMTGVYYGNGALTRPITRLPFTPDFVFTKRNNNTAGVWRTSDVVGDKTLLFSAAVNAADCIESLNANGFTIGANATVNTSGSYYYWFAFKEGTKFKVATFTGSASNQSPTIATGFDTGLIWIKRDAATVALAKTASMANANAQNFSAAADVASKITALDRDSFTVTGGATETNVNATTSYYAAWSVDSSVTVAPDGTQTANVNSNTEGNYLGGAWTLVRNRYSTPITSITVSDTGTATAQNALTDFTLRYETAGTCTYDGNETVFATSGTFNGSEQSTVTGSMDVGTSQVCLYAVADTTSSLSQGQTVEIQITNPSTEMTPTYGTVATATAQAISGTTTLNYVAIAISLTSDGTVAFGALPVGNSTTTLAGDLNDSQVVKNTGSDTADINIQATDATGGVAWSLAAFTGTNLYTLDFSTNAGSLWNALTVPDSYALLTSGLASNATSTVDLRITVPTATSDTVTKSITVTLQAVAP